MSWLDVGVSLLIGGVGRRGCGEAGDKGRLGKLQGEGGGWTVREGEGCSVKEEAMPAGDPGTPSPSSPPNLFMVLEFQLM